MFEVSGVKNCPELGALTLIIARIIHLSYLYPLYQLGVSQKAKALYGVRCSAWRDGPHYVVHDGCKEYFEIVEG